MNMISTGAFLNEMDASSKQPSTAEKLAAVWEKKNAKAARAGGVSLMALSLAACGGSSSTTSSSSSSTTTTTTTPTSQSFTLTTAVNAFTGGDGADTFTGTGATFTALDALDGGAGADTLTITDSTDALESGLPAGTTVTGIETVNVDASGGIGAIATSAVAQVNTYAAVTVTADVAGVTQYVAGNATAANGNYTITYNGNTVGYTGDSNSGTNTATALTAAINTAAGSTVAYKGGTAAVNNAAGEADTTMIIDTVVGTPVVGMSVTGTGVSAGTYITAYDSVNSVITTNQAVAVANNAALTIGGGVGGVTVKGSGSAQPTVGFSLGTGITASSTIAAVNGNEGDSVTVNYGGQAATYLVGATATATGANLATAINGLAGSTVAVNASGVVTVTAATAGTALPAITFSGASGNAPAVTYTTANVTSATGAQYDMSGFTGMTKLVGTAEGAINLKLAATTDAELTTSTGAVTVAGGEDITLTHSNTGANAITIAAGADVTVNANKATTGTVTLTKPTGDVDVNYNAATFGNTANASLGAITVSSAGATADVTTVSGAGAATLAATNYTVTQGAVGVTGGASTTTVNVTQDAAVTAAAGATVAAGGKIGVVAGAVTVADKNAASATAAGSINTVSLTNFGNSTIDSGALTTLNVTGTGGTLGVTAGALTTAVVDTLAMNVNSATAVGNITLDADYTTLNIAGSGTKSTIADITSSGAKTVTFSGDGELVFTDQSLTAVTSVTSTNTAGVTLGTTAIGAGVAVTMGSGNDKVVMSNTATKAIDLGAGNDQLTYGGAVSTATTSTGAAAGGDGEDTIVMTSDQAEAADNSNVFNSKFTGFEVLKLSDALDAASTLDLSALGGVSKVILAVSGDNATTSDISNLASGGTVEVLATGTGFEALVANALGGASDVLNVILTNSTTGAEAFGQVTAPNVETINISLNDAGTTTSTAATIDTATLVATAAKTVNVSGPNGLTLTNTGNTAITTFDASGVKSDGSTTTAGAANDTAANLAVTFASANTTATAAVTITGGDGDDTLTGNAAKDTISGGAGDDVITGGTGQDTLSGGANNDVFHFVSDRDTTGGSTTIDSTTTAHDVITGFTTLGAVSTSTDLSTAAKFQASATVGTSDALSLNFDVDDNGGSDQAISVESDVTTATAGQAANVTYLVSNGILTLGGNGAAAVDTLAEWLVEAAGVAATGGEVIAFEFSGDTYIFGENGTQDMLIELDGVTGVDALVELSSTFTTTATNAVAYLDIA